MRPSLTGDTEEVATETLEDYGLKEPLPGHILYARLISQANSDAPAPIIAEIVQGEMAGSRVLGSFTVANEKLILEFNTLVIEKTLSGKIQIKVSQLPQWPLILSISDRIADKSR